jgi:hypothetical protein
MRQRGAADAAETVDTDGDGHEGLLIRDLAAV